MLRPFKIALIVCLLESAFHKIPLGVRAWAIPVFREQPAIALGQMLFHGARLVALYALFIVGIEPLLALVCRALFPARAPRFAKAWPTRIAIAVAMVLFLTLTRSRWGGTSIPSPAAGRTGGKPSFALVAFDGVPADYFRNQKLAPRWAQSAKSGIDFANAYALTNSTLTSWYTILTSRAPAESGIRVLLPSRAALTRPRGPTVAERLRAEGYRTIFATDCSSTLILGEAEGFDETIQLGKGVYPCGAAHLYSSHALVNLLSIDDKPNYFFPEVDTACSRSYRPHVFFNRVKAAISAQSSPYFLALHSCSTEQFLHGSDSDPKGALLQSLARADDLFADFREVFHKKVWVFFTADHGLRVGDEGGKTVGLSHAVGDPVSRYQYHVPLTVWPAAGTDFEPRVHEPLVGLVDIAETIAQEAGLSPIGNGIALPLRRENLPERKLILTTSLPTIEGKSPSQILRSAEIDRQGRAYFPQSVENELTETGDFAELILPWRTIYRRGLPIGRYHELDDPLGNHLIPPAAARAARN